MLILINDAPYGSERMYNALRLAGAVIKTGQKTITVFLMGDAVSAAKAGQKTPDGYYNTERMLKRLGAAGADVLLCGTCLDARGLVDAELVVGSRRSTLDELAVVTVQSEKVLVF
ncbi:TPA: DsrE family protein [Stenotrophomonas maltophilia]|nr:DsrE family protein [Stenotrophomonas maltophilia]